jgi:hypothetical protein
MIAAQLVVVIEIGVMQMFLMSLEMKYALGESQKVLIYLHVIRATNRYDQIKAVD